MRIVFSEGQSEEIINKSKFIGYSVVASSRECFLERLREIKINNPSASHAVYGLQIKRNSIEPYFSDDGEPTGTGGRPLLNILESRKIINCGLVVVRYYGGINLGMGGLARAYSQAGLKAIQASSLNDYIELYEYKLIIKYNNLKSISKAILDNKGTIIDRIFDQNITLKVSMSVATKELLEKRFPMTKIQSLT